MSGRPRTCDRCGRKPVATKAHRCCYDCQPGGPVSPPPCRRCGATTNYFSAGLCGRCHQYAPQRPDACRDCHAWGVTRHRQWLCHGCAHWRRTRPAVGRCRICQQPRHLDTDGACRLCWRQACRARRPNKRIDLVTGNRHGQQLFLANMVDRLGHPRPRPPRPPAPPLRPAYPVTHRQLVLVELPRDLVAGHRHGFGDPPDPTLAAALDAVARAHGARHGWSSTRTLTVRNAIRVLLTLQDTPGAPIKASHAALLPSIGLPLRAVLATLDQAGMLDDDRTAAIEHWFARKIADLPPAMATELRTWFEVLRHGSPTPPRSRPRDPVTIRTRLRWALPTLHAWAAAGHHSLRDITRDDVLAALPPSGNDRATLGVALRSVFAVLKARKLTFTNPTARIRTGHPASNHPLPVDLRVVRDGLASPDRARAAITALVAFHGLRSGHLRHLRLTDLRDGRLHLDDRTILLAAPVRQRLAAWLDERARRWPNTANPHLLVHYRTATRTGPVGGRWLNLKLGISVQAVREDRILHEAHANAGDIRRLCDLFGLSVPAASRYAATIDHPGLAGADQPTPSR